MRQHLGDVVSEDIIATILAGIASSTADTYRKHNAKYLQFRRSLLCTEQEDTQQHALEYADFLIRIQRIKPTSIASYWSALNHKRRMNGMRKLKGEWMSLFAAGAKKSRRDSDFARVPVPATPFYALWMQRAQWTLEERTALVLALFGFLTLVRQATLSAVELAHLQPIHGEKRLFFQAPVIGFSLVLVTEKNKGHPRIVSVTSPLAAQLYNTVQEIIAATPAPDSTTVRLTKRLRMSPDEAMVVCSRLLASVGASAAPGKYTYHSLRAAGVSNALILKKTGSKVQWMGGWNAWKTMIKSYFYPNYVPGQHGFHFAHHFD